MLIAWFSGAGSLGDGPLILLVALALDAAVGDPSWLYRAVSHPVAVFGRLVAAGEARLNGAEASARARLVRGGVLGVALAAGAGAFGWALESVLMRAPGGWIMEAVVASTLIAGRGLHDHVRAVAAGLDSGLKDARAAVAHIVGRDPASLDAAGVARAAVESTAENLSDGVVAPVVWFAIFGLGGLAAYKAINTLDSMIGYRSARYRAFGKLAARLDDVANWAPARLSGVLLVMAAALLPGASPRGAWRAMARDAPRHRSPNAGWPEAAMAGALGFALGGARRYGGETVMDRWMGDGCANLGAAEVRRALRLYLSANGVLAVMIAVLAVASQAAR